MATETPDATNAQAVDWEHRRHLLEELKVSPVPPPTMRCFGSTDQSYELRICKCIFKYKFISFLWYKVKNKEQQIQCETVSLKDINTSYLP